jgi:hypothetical protein
MAALIVVVEAEGQMNIGAAIWVRSPDGQECVGAVTSNNSLGREHEGLPVQFIVPNSVRMLKGFYRVCAPNIT